MIKDKTRLEGAVDPTLMDESHILVVGVGGASGLCEDLVRTGLGKLTAIDFDVVDDSNLTTQGFYPEDIGKPKIDALGETLRRVSSGLEYRGLQKDLLKIPDKTMDSICADVDLLLFMTDDFHAQARGNVLSLRTGIPAIFAMMYEGARAAEITYNLPGLMPVCHRCAVHPRYKAYEDGYRNDVSSHGSTIFSTHYLNACLGHLALAILHRDSSNLEFANWLDDRIEMRQNLIQLRLSPHFGNGAETVFNRTYDGCSYPNRMVAFDGIWQRVAERECPDCG